MKNNYIFKRDWLHYIFYSIRSNWIGECRTASSPGQREVEKKLTVLGDLRRHDPQQWGIGDGEKKSGPLKRFESWESLNVRVFVPIHRAVSNQKFANNSLAHTFPIPYAFISLFIFIITYLYITSYASMFGQKWPSHPNWKNKRTVPTKCLLTTMYVSRRVWSLFLAV